MRLNLSFVSGLREFITGFRWWRRLAALLIILIALVVGEINQHDTYDDAFIIFRYAYQFATGQGFVYNPGVRHLSITAPLYGLLLGAVGRLSPEHIPEFAGYFSILSLIAIGLGLFRFGHLHRQAFCGFVAGILFVTHPLLIHTFGGEMLVQLALIAWAFVFYKEEKTVLAALFVGMAVLVRPDALLVGGILGIHFLLVKRRIPWREGLVLAGVLSPFVGLAWLYFGALYPDTLGSRLAQRDSGLWMSFLKGAWEWIKAFTVGGSTVFRRFVPFPDTLRMAGLFGLGIPAVFYFRFWLLPLAWVGSYMAFYQVIGVPFYHWYLIPLIFGMAILTACGFAGLVELAGYVYQRIFKRVNSWVVKGLVGVLGMMALGMSITAQMMHMRELMKQEPDPVEAVYKAVGTWLNENTPREASVGYFELGYVGFYSQRTMVDPLGLVDPIMLPHVSKQDFRWAYEYFRPDYILVNHRNPRMSADVDSLWFQEEYVPLQNYFVDGYVDLTVFERKPGLP